jgi:hypothetical protein
VNECEHQHRMVSALTARFMLVAMCAQCGQTLAELPKSAIVADPNALANWCEHNGVRITDARHHLAHGY